MRLFSSTIKADAAEWTARRDAGVSPSEEAELQAWLDADPRHREALAECDSTWSVLDRPYQAGAGDELLTAVETRVRRRRRRRVAGTMAALVILMAAGFLWRVPNDTAIDPLAPRRSDTAMVIVPAREILRDGSVVELNAGAGIFADFSGKYRRVVLQKGEAHFQVVADASRPFIVVVDRVEIRAVGTAFSVQREAEKVEVLVTEGQVAVDKHREAAPEPDTTTIQGAGVAPRTLATLWPGYRAVVGLAATDEETPEVEFLPAPRMNERLAWRAPRLEFTGATLSEAVALLNEQADRAAAAGLPGKRYAIGDPEVASVRISGLFRVDNTDSFVRLLKHGFGIEAELRDGSDVIVLRKSHQHR